MALMGIGTPELQQDSTEEVPVVLGIALDDGIRTRLAALLDGTGVVMFTPDVATARAILGRHAVRARATAGPNGWHDEPVVRFGELEVDRVRCRARWRGMPLALTKRDRDLLAGLAAEPARVWTYRQLHAAAWGGRYLDPGPVHAAMKRLRRKLREAAVQVRIDAVRGVGYQLVDIADNRGSP